MKILNHKSHSKQQRQIPVNFTDSEFCVFAVKVLKEGSVGQRKLKSNIPYFFRSGFEICDDDSLSIDTTKMCVNGLYDEMSIPKKRRSVPHVSVTAIVGENGSGKSTLIEFMLRILNNFAAKTLGDTLIFPGAERLHHVSDVHGELYFIIDKIPYKLHMSGNNCNLRSYRLVSFGGGKYKFTKESTPIYTSSKNNIEFLSYNSSHILSLKKLYSHCFYSMVCNYSIYAYNTRDYIDEANSIDEERKKRHKHLKKVGKNFIAISSDMRVWLKGIFHKNDGYQTPIVLFPLRSEGCIDINVEKELAEERLQSLILNDKFSRVNEHLEVIGYEISSTNNWGGNLYTIQNDFDLQYLDSDYYETLKKKILGCWGRFLGQNILINNKNYVFHEQALEYLVYKTIKISFKYTQYREYYDLLKSSLRFSATGRTRLADKYLDYYSKGVIHRLIKDESHITKKVKLTLAYLIFGVYEPGRISVKLLISNLLDKLITFRVKNRTNSLLLKIFKSIDNLLPPPFLKISLILEDTVEKKEVKFDTLSSGERQLVYTASSIIYHLHNLDSVSSDSDRISYQYINLILEEIELYFHPDMQKKFVKFLIGTIQTASLSNIKSINIMMVTHSPFVLSDIPHTNILALNKEGQVVNSRMYTFGANIHTLLSSTFFMKNGTIGEYAQWMINYIVSALKLWQWTYSNPNVNLIQVGPEDETIKLYQSDIYEYKAFTNYDEDSVYYYIAIDIFKSKMSKERIKSLINTFENSLIEDALLKEFYATFPKEEIDKDNEIKELKLKLEKLTGGKVYVETK